MIDNVKLGIIEYVTLVRRAYNLLPMKSLKSHLIKAEIIMLIR